MTKRLIAACGLDCTKNEGYADALARLKRMRSTDREGAECNW